MFISYIIISLLITYLAQHTINHHPISYCFSNTIELMSERIYKTDLANQTLLLKMDSHFGYKDDIKHEYNIGLDINTIRDRVPNFIGTIGYLKCNIGNNNTKPCIMSNNNYDREYLVLEYAEGRSLINVANDLSINNNDYNNILLQIIMALDIAQKELGFVHYDLHMKNILIHKLPKLTKLLYGQYSIETQYLPRILDYGRSYTHKVGGRIYWNCGVYDKYNEYHDIIYLLYTINKYKNNSKYINLPTRIPVYEKIRKYFNLPEEYVLDGCRLNKILNLTNIPHISSNFKRLLKKLNLPRSDNKKIMNDINLGNWIHMNKCHRLYNIDEVIIDNQLQLHIYERELSKLIPIYYEGVLNDLSPNSSALYNKIEQIQRILNINPDLKRLLQFDYNAILLINKDILKLIKNNNISDYLYQLINNENIYSQSGYYYLIRQKKSDKNIIIDENTGLYYVR